MLSGRGREGKNEREGYPISRLAGGPPLSVVERHALTKEPIKEGVRSHSEMGMLNKKCGGSVVGILRAGQSKCGWNHHGRKGTRH